MWRKEHGLCQNLWILVRGSAATSVTLAQPVTTLALNFSFANYKWGLGDPQDF